MNKNSVVETIVCIYMITIIYCDSIMSIGESSRRSGHPPGDHLTEKCKTSRSTLQHHIQSMRYSSYRRNHLLLLLERCLPRSCSTGFPQSLNLSHLSYARHVILSKTDTGKLYRIAQNSLRGVRELQKGIETHNGRYFAKQAVQIHLLIWLPPYTMTWKLKLAVIFPSTWCAKRLCIESNSVLNFPHHSSEHFFWRLWQRTRPGNDLFNVSQFKSPH